MAVGQDDVNRKLNLRQNLPSLFQMFRPLANSSFLWSLMWFVDARPSGPEEQSSSRLEVLGVGGGLGRDLLLILDTRKSSFKKKKKAFSAGWRVKLPHPWFNPRDHLQQQ